MRKGGGGCWNCFFLDQWERLGEFLVLKYRSVKETPRRRIMVLSSWNEISKNHLEEGEGGEALLRPPPPCRLLTDISRRHEPFFPPPRLFASRMEGRAGEGIPGVWGAGVGGGGQWWAKWRYSTFDLYPWGEGHGVQGQICDILRPQLAMNCFLLLWQHRFSHFGCINLGGGGVEGLWH